MCSDYREKLELHRVQLVDHLDLGGRMHVLTYLRSKNDFNCEDCEIVLNNGFTRQQKVSKFLDLLATRGPVAFNHFLESLENVHPYLFAVLTGENPEKGHESEENSYFPREENYYQHDKETLTEKLTKYCNENCELVLQSSKLSKDKKVLQQKVDSLEKTVSLLENQISEMQKEREEIDLRHQQKIKNLQEGVTVLEKRIEERSEKSENEKLCGFVAQLKYQQSVESFRQIIVDLTKQLMKANKNYQSVKRNSKRFTKKVCETNKEVCEVDYLKNELLKANEAINVAEAKLEKLCFVTQLMTKKFNRLKRKLDLRSFEKVSSDSEEKTVNQLYAANKKLKTVVGMLEGKVLLLTKQLEQRAKEWDVYESEREKQLREHSKICRERDECFEYNKYLQQTKDSDVQKYRDIIKQRQEQYLELSKEFNKFRAKMSECQKFEKFSNQTQVACDKMYENACEMPSQEHFEENADGDLQRSNTVVLEDATKALLNGMMSDEELHSLIKYRKSCSLSSLDMMAKQSSEYNKRFQTIDNADIASSRLNDLPPIRRQRANCLSSPKKRKAKPSELLIYYKCT